MEPVTLGAGLAAAAAAGSAWHLRRRAQRAESEARWLREELRAARHAATHDPLTGLCNRRGFHHLGTALLAAEPPRRLLAVVVDIDDFKLVNDRFGHLVGDEVLITVARRLAVAAEDSIVARLGGDEFAGLLRGDGICLGRTARRLYRTLNAPMRAGGRELLVTTSIGMALLRAGEGLAEALVRADAAMYHQKALDRPVAAVPRQTRRSAALPVRGAEHHGPAAPRRADRPRRVLSLPRPTA